MPFFVDVREASHFEKFRIPTATIVIHAFKIFKKN